MPTQPQPFVPWLSVATQALQGRQKRQDVDYERNQEERAYNDQQAFRQQQLTQQAEAQDYARAQDRRQNERQAGLDQRTAFEGGYDPIEQTHAQGAADFRKAAPLQTGADLVPSYDVGAANTAAEKMNAAPVFSLGGTGYAKNRLSAAELAATQAQQARDADQREARQYRTEDLAAAAQQRAADQAFQASENAKNRAVQMRARDMRPQAGDGLTPRQQMPTEGERKASAFYISGRQGYDTMEALLNGSETKDKAVPSWWGQQAAKIGMGAGNVLTNNQTRQLRQAANQMADAWLRYTSGAAVPEQEVQRFSESFIPAPGDDETTLSQKAAARRKIMEALEAGAGRAMPSTGIEALRGAPPNPTRFPAGNNPMPAGPRSPGDLVKR